MAFKQEPHKLLVIPGPIELADDVLYANAHPSMSHVSPDFIPVFGDCIRMIRQVVRTTTAQPFLIAGSGTLGWDQVAANLLAPGEKALVCHSGYFGDGFADCLAAYGVAVEQVKAPVGRAVSQRQLEEALGKEKYKVVIFTHVDTSTGVLTDAKMVAETVRRVSPDSLVVMDAVCSVASETILFDEWDLDIVLSASQKGLGTPPGLSILLASPRALSAFSTRTEPVHAYYASWGKWLPIMRAYEEGRPAYFATPPVNLVYAFHASLKTITGRGDGGVEERLQKHREASRRVKEAVKSLGLKQVPVEDGEAANGMTAVYFPEGFAAQDVVAPLAKKGIIVATGLHKDIKEKYFRIGHMGVTVVDEQRRDIDKLVDGLNSVFSK